MEKENPKAAFPVYAKDDGMTLRDYFAAAAMQAVLGEPTAVKAIDKAWPDALDKRIAIGAYNIADAMLKEREKRAADTAAATG